MAAMRGLMERLRDRVIVQIREKDLDARTLVSWCTRASDISRGTGSQVLLSGRADVVQTLRHEGGRSLGLHLAENDIELTDARRLFGEDIPLSCSVHTPERAGACAELGANAVVIAPVYPTLSKPATLGGDAPVLGLDGLTRAVEAVRGRAALFALGGIDRARALDILELGVDGLAAIRAAWTGELEPLFRG